MSAAASAVLTIVAPATAAASVCVSPVSVETDFGRVRVGQTAVATARAEGAAARDAARTVLGLQTPRFEIIDPDCVPGSTWGARAATGEIVYVWRFAPGEDGRSQPPPAYLLRHEIGHDLFVRHLVPATRADQYGGDAPDWLDEMAAVAFEDEALRATRRRAVARHAAEGKLIPLAALLRMTHPEWQGNAAAFRLNGPATAFQPSSGETLYFYPMCLAFYDYLLARTGRTTIVAELAAAFRRGVSLDTWLPERLGLRGGIDRVDSDFRDWLASDPRYVNAVSH